MQFQFSKLKVDRLLELFRFSLHARNNESLIPRQGPRIWVLDDLNYAIFNIGHPLGHVSALARVFDSLQTTNSLRRFFI